MFLHEKIFKEGSELWDGMSSGILSLEQVHANILRLFEEVLSEIRSEFKNERIPLEAFQRAVYGYQLGVDKLAKANKFPFERDGLKIALIKAWPELEGRLK